MTTNFPGGLDDFQNPQPTTKTNSSNPFLKHARQHQNINDAVEALEAKVGITASQVTSSLEWRLARLEALLGSTLSQGWPTGQRDVANSSFQLTTQGLRLAYFTAQKSGTTTGIRVHTAVTPAGATPTLIRMGLWTSNAAGDGLSLVASTANDTTLLSVASTEYNKAWSAPYNMIQGQRYVLGILVVTAATSPSIVSIAENVITEMAKEPRVCALLGAQANLPASWVAASLTGSSFRPYLVATE